MNTAKKARPTAVTPKMLYLVRDELKHETRSLEHRMDGRFADADARMSALEARMERLEARLESMETTLNRMALLNEEQHARNNIVLEALQAMIARQDRVEARLDALEETVRSLAKSRRN